MTTPDNEIRGEAKRLVHRTNEHAVAVLRAGHAQVIGGERATDDLWDAIDRFLEGGVDPRLAIFALARSTGAVMLAVENRFGLDAAAYMESLEHEHFRQTNL